MAGSRSGPSVAGRAVSILCVVASLMPTSLSAQPVRVGVVGLVHTHVHWILGRPDRGDIEIVGIVEPDRELAQRYADQHGYSMQIVFDTMEEMIEATLPEAVTAFGTIYDHLEVVEKAAPRGIHIMVEKPLAVSLEHARRMKALAEKHEIHLLTNYETSWYPTVHAARRIVDAGTLGTLRKIVVHDGHGGPIEIGVNDEFLEWLVDPTLNGGGALTDFGCYGANLITWLMGNQRPLTVTAVTQHIKPNLYPNVEDEATIVVTYPGVHGIIQASWNWPVSRKDMEVYGATGQFFADNSTDMRVQLAETVPEQRTVLRADAPFDDPFSYLEAVVRGRVDPGEDLSSLSNNIVVMEILDAARKSAESGRTVRLGATPATIVIVHGAWGGGWAFREVEQLLRDSGHQVYRPTLTGQGERYHLASPEIGLETHINDIISVLEFEELEDVVLVGHSYGGMVVTGVADRVPGRIRHLVYLDAFVPVDGESMADLAGDFMARLEDSGALADSGFVDPVWVESGSPPPKDVRQSMKTFTDPIRLQSEPGNGLTVSYIITRETPGADDSFDSSADRALDLGWTLYEFVADHNPQWSRPTELAALLSRIR